MSQIMRAVTYYGTWNPAVNPKALAWIDAGDILIDAVGGYGKTNVSIAISYEIAIGIASVAKVTT